MKIIKELKKKYIIWKLRRRLKDLPPEQLIKAITTFIITQIIAKEVINNLNELNKPKKKKKKIKK